jgi:hypothetical protein
VVAWLWEGQTVCSVKVVYRSLASLRVARASTHKSRYTSTHSHSNLGDGTGGEPNERQERERGQGATGLHWRSEGCRVEFS